MTFHALPILLCFPVSGPDFWVIHNTLPPLDCMTGGLLYQRSVTLIPNQRSSGHIGDVAQPLALDKCSELHNPTTLSPGKMSWYSRREGPLWIPEASSRWQYELNLTATNRNKILSKETWKWGQQVPPKCWYPWTAQHNSTPQLTVMRHTLSICGNV